jgi:putative ABC transport system substrate-binding protein
MNRRTLLGTLALLAPGSVLGADRVLKVGFIAARNRPPKVGLDATSGLLEGLRGIGHAEGADFVVDWRFAGNDPAEIDRAARELAAAAVDVIVTEGTVATLAAQQASARIPIVFATAADPLRNGLVKSLTRPGGTTTGVSLGSGDTGLKQLELLQAVVPGLKRVGAVVNPGNPSARVVVETIRGGAAQRGLDLSVQEIGRLADVEPALERAGRGGVAALLIVPDSLFLQERVRIARLAVARSLPSVGSSREYAEAGCLMSYGEDLRENYRRAAGHVDRIWKGASPGELPVIQVLRPLLVVNKRTARALGLQLPPDLLVLADQVIE